MNTKQHPTAIISKKAQLGNNITIGPYAIIEDDVIIKDGTTIGPHVYIANGARIGEQCSIHKGAVVATVPQDLKFKGEQTTFEIGAHTVVREFCTLNRGTGENGKTSVGSNCLLMAYTHVAHDCIVGNNVILANSINMGGHVHIEDFVIIGGATVVHQFVSIGQHSMVGGNFRAVKDIPPYILAGREPLSYENLNIVGLRRRGFSQENINAIKEAYHLLYFSHLNVSQAIEKIQATLTITPEIQNILTFIKNSKRGIIGNHTRE